MADPTRRAPDDHIPPVGFTKGHSRLDWGKHRAMVRSSNKARRKAEKLLIAEHPEAWSAIYAECAAAEGVTPLSRVRFMARQRAVDQRLEEDAERILAEVEPEHASVCEEQAWLVGRLDQLTTLLGRVERDDDGG